MTIRCLVQMPFPNGPSERVLRCCGEMKNRLITMGLFFLLAAAFVCGEALYNDFRVGAGIYDVRCCGSGHSLFSAPHFSCPR